MLFGVSGRAPSTGEQVSDQFLDRLHCLVPMDILETSLDDIGGTARPLVPLARFQQV